MFKLSFQHLDICIPPWLVSFIKIKQYHVEECIKKLDSIKATLAIFGLVLRSLKKKATLERTYNSKICFRTMQLM